MAFLPELLEFAPSALPVRYVLRARTMTTGMGTALFVCLDLFPLRPGLLPLPNSSLAPFKPLSEDDRGSVLVVALRCAKSLGDQQSSVVTERQIAGIMAKQHCAILILDVHECMEERGLRLAKDALTMHALGRLGRGGQSFMGLVLAGSKATCNSVNEECGDGYENIFMDKAFEPTDAELLRKIERAELGGQEGGDIIEAIIVAMGMMQDVVGPRNRKSFHIVIATNGRSPFAEVELEIIKAIQDQEIDIKIFGIGFAKRHADMSENEQRLKDVLACTGGTIVPVSSREQLRRDFPVLNKVAPTFNQYSGPLRLIAGMTIQVKAYPATMKGKLGKLPKAVTTSGSETSVERHFFLSEERSAEVPVDERINAFAYGGECVPIGNEEEKKIHMSNNEGKKSMMIHCFCKRDQIMQHWLVSDVDVVVSDPSVQEPSTTTFSSLVEAMSTDVEESNGYVAIARWVKKDKQPKGPEMYALFPVISESVPQYSLRCVQLAFKEQLRPCTAFADFDTTLVTEEQGAASRELIQRLTLPEPKFGYLVARRDGKGANVLGGPSNRGHDLEQACFPPNPAHQRHWDIVHHVTVHGADVPIPEVGVIESLEGDKDLFEEAAGALSRMKLLFELATKEERQAKREGGGYDDKPAEGATTGAVEMRFERKWNDQEDLDAHDDAIKLMEDAILELVAEGGPAANKNAVFLLKRLRSQCQGGVSDEADQFNAVLARLEGSYGGADRKHPFWAVVGDEKVLAIPVRGSRPREGGDAPGNKEEGQDGGAQAGEPEGKRQKVAQEGGGGGGGGAGGGAAAAAAVGKEGGDNVVGAEDKEDDILADAF